MIQQTAGALRGAQPSTSLICQLVRAEVL